MRLLDKFGYLSVQQIRDSEFDGQVAYLDKEGGAGSLAVLTAADVVAWAPLASATPPCSLVVNYEDQQGDWMGGGWAVGVQKGLWVQRQLAAVGITDVPVVYFSADFHPGDALPAVLQCLRGAQSVLGAQARGIYGFVETLDAAKAAGLADYFWLCGDQRGLQGRPWINLYQHNNDQGSVGGVVVDINDVLTPGQFGAWLPGGTTPTTPGGFFMALTDQQQQTIYDLLTAAPFAEFQYRMFRDTTTGEIVLAAPGQWVHVPAPAYTVLYRARRLVRDSEPEDLATNEFQHFKAIYQAVGVGDVSALAAKLAALMPAPAAVAPMAAAPAPVAAPQPALLPADVAKAVNDEADARARARLTTATGVTP